ncbi:hypothetical protein [Streptomyces sp. KL116D]|uniref:hypothetical protein n=1 Tax=Streptomyces sp. KL116D TaxID=3045152 RepID=UPI003556A473
MRNPAHQPVVTSQARRHLWLIELAGTVTEHELGSLYAATTTALGRHARLPSR